MKRLSVLILTAGALVLGFAQPMDNTMPLGFYILQSLEQVELEGKVMGFGFLDGRFVLKIDDSYVLFPLRFIGMKDVIIEFGETLKVIGRKVDVDGKILILPGKIFYAGKEFDIGRYVMRFMEARRMRIGGRQRIYNPRFPAPGVPFMRFRGVPRRAPIMTPERGM